MTHKPTDKSFGNTYLSVNTRFQSSLDQPRRVLFLFLILDNGQVYRLGA